MTHPILAVRQLAGDGVRYQCSGGPAWLRAAVEHDSASVGAVIPVVWGESAVDAATLAAAPAFVGIDSATYSDDLLRGAGFPHIRRFAMLPSAAQPRWLIPLDPPGIAAAALALYRPVRTSRRVLHAAARAAARLGLHVWYRDELCIARRAASPIEQRIASLFPGTTVRLAISTGAPGRAQLRKLSMAVVSTGGRVLAFAKSGASPASRALVRHEAEVLRTLSAREALANRVPRLLFSGEVGDAWVHVQAPLAGTSARAELAAPEHALLAALRSAELRPAADTAFVRGLRARIAALPPSHHWLLRALDAMRPRLEWLRLPSTVIHGDFAPWNIRVDHGVAAAFDWEYAEPDGLPLVDQCNHLLLVGYLVHGWTTETALAELRAMSYAAPLGLDPSDVEVLQILHLLDLVTRFLSEGAGAEPMTHWFLQLLLQLSGRARPAARGIRDHASSHRTPNEAVL